MALRNRGPIRPKFFRNDQGSRLCLIVLLTLIIETELSSSIPAQNSRFARDVEEEFVIPDDKPKQTENRPAMTENPPAGTTTVEDLSENLDDGYDDDDDDDLMVNSRGIGSGVDNKTSADTEQDLDDSAEFEGSHTEGSDSPANTDRPAEPRKADSDAETPAPTEKAVPGETESPQSPMTESSAHEASDATVAPKPDHENPPHLQASTESPSTSATVSRSTLASFGLSILIFLCTVTVTTFSNSI